MPEPAAQPNTDPMTVPKEGPDAPFGAVPNVETPTPQQETVNELQTLNKKFDEYRESQDQKYEALLAENNRLKGVVETNLNQPQHSQQDSIDPEVKRLAGEYSTIERQLESLDIEISKAQRSEEFDEKRIAKLKAQQRSLEKKQTAIERQYENLENEFEVKKQSSVDQKNANAFMQGVGKAMQTFPELTDGRGNLNPNAPLYQMARMILDEGATHSKFARGVRATINPDFDHPNGFYYAVLEAKSRLGGGNTGGNNGMPNVNDQPLTGGVGSSMQQSDDNTPYGGVTLKQLNQLREKYYNNPDPSTHKEWVKKSFAYKVAKEKANRR